MKLSEHAEEILEAMWIAIEEEGAAFYDPAKMQLPKDDAACRELTVNSLVELRHGMLYFRQEGREEGEKDHPSPSSGRTSDDGCLQYQGGRGGQ